MRKQDETNDRLRELFDLQEEFQKFIQKDDALYKEQPDVQFMMYTIVALIDELMEALRETPWKTWKKHQTLNHDHLKEEIIDAWHFLINLSMAAGMDSAEVYDLFIKKSKINRERQIAGR